MFLLLLLHYYHHLRVMFPFIFKIIFTTSGLLSSYGALCQTQTRSCFNHYHSASTHPACRRRCTASGSFSSIRSAIFDASTDKTSSCATFHHSASTRHPCRPWRLTSGSFVSTFSIRFYTSTDFRRIQPFSRARSRWPGRRLLDDKDDSSPTHLFYEHWAYTPHPPRPPRTLSPAPTSHRQQSRQQQRVLQQKKHLAMNGCEQTSNSFQEIPKESCPQGAGWNFAELHRFDRICHTFPPSRPPMSSLVLLQAT